MGMGISSAWNFEWGVNVEIYYLDYFNGWKVGVFDFIDLNLCRLIHHALTTNSRDTTVKMNQNYHEFCA